METENEINGKILKIIKQIQEEYPHLAVLIDEMPITIPNENHPDVNVKILKDYYDSLQIILNKFTQKYHNQ